MIKTIINRFIKAALDELFVDSPSVHLSMGSDMFSDSKINLSNLTFRPDLFDVLGQPFVLRAGHLGCLNVEGIAELAIGGQLKFMAEDIFLLFGLDIIPDPERTQSLKKILIEMQNPKFSSIIITDLIKKLVGLSCGPESDIKAKRKTLYKIFDYFTKGFFFTIKNIHIRFEFKLPGAEIGKDCNGIGVTIPLIKIMPTSTQSRPPEIPQQNPVLSFIVKSIQIYVDYGREQYSQDNLGSIVEFFKRQSNSEKHLTLLGLFDLEMVLALDVKRKTGLICPKLFIHIPRVRVSIDKDQLEVIDQAVNAVACVKRRFQQASRVQKIFRSGHPLPRVSEITSIRLLPHLSLRGTSYPRCAIPRAVAVGLVAFMKDRVGSRWPVMLWKHLIRLVLHDLRRVRPFGRWREIIWLTKVRREYAFSYARLLKRVNDSVGFIYNIHSTLPASKMRDLFEFEMILSVDAVLMFRTLAYMVAAVGFFYYKKRTSNQYSPSMGEGSLTWRDILKIFTELFEAKRESAFHRFDRTRHDDEDDNLSVDDASTVKYSDDGTVYSHTTQTRIPIPFEERNTPNKGTPSSKSSLSMHQVTKKLFSGIGFGSVVSDDADVKIFGRLDFSSFGESVSSLLDKDDRIKDALGVGEAPFIITDDLEGIIKGSVSSTNFHLAQIVDAVQWVMVRHQDPLTFLPPDVSLKIDKFAAELKQPSDGSQGDRLILGAMQISDLHVTLNISQSSSVGTERGTPNSSEKIKIPRGFSSLSGALIQLRVVTKQFSISLSVPQATRMEASKRLVSESNLVHLESFQTRTHSNGGVDLNQSISSHGPVSLNNFPDDTNSESEDSCRVGTMNDLKVNLIPGKTVMESISYQRSLLEQEERKKDIQRANSDVAMARKLKSTEINIDTPVFSMKVLRPADSGSFDEVLREIITSNSNDLALVFCLILDLDDKGEGAADLQIQVGGLTADMDSQAMSSLLNPKYCEYFGVLGEVYQDIQQSLKLFDDSVILLDWASKSPLVGCAFDFLSDQEQIVEDMDTLSLNEEKDSHEIGNGSDYESRDNKRNQRKAIIFYRGFIQWLTFLEQKLPRVLSLCFRSGPVLIQSLESSIIRNLVFAKFQSVIDRAVNRGSGHSKSTELEGVFLLLRQLIRKDDSFREKMRRREFRKWGSKTKGMSNKFVYEKNSELEDTQSPNNSHVKILIPAIDFVVAKLTVPYPSLSIEVQGHSIIKLPMSDETICHYLAWFLAEIMPVEK